MRVKELCRPRPVTCASDLNLAQAVALMWESNAGALIVVDVHDRPMAIVTDRDVAIALGTRDLPASAMKVKEVMTRRLYTCLAEDDILNAIRIMVRNGVRRLPVINAEARVVGLLSVDDLVLAARGNRNIRG